MNHNPQTAAKAVASALGAVLTVVALWVYTGQFNTTEAIAAVVGLVQTLAVFGVPNRPKVSR